VTPCQRSVLTEQQPSPCSCSLSKGGAPPRFLIIDDGWQQIASDNKPDPNVAVQEGAQYVHCICTPPITFL